MTMSDCNWLDFGKMEGFVQGWSNKTAGNILDGLFGFARFAFALLDVVREDGVVGECVLRLSFVLVCQSPLWGVCTSSP